ncbi:MAG TPA: alpha/beta fold hydrolase [Acidimicrobiia bacterium]|nr:alpha/beta fold hydrolase [Acidimicrobiia bacterium]
MSATDQYAKINGLRLHYREWSGPAADAPLLLLLHGFTSNASTWELFADTFTTRYRVIATDARGHGASDWAAPDAYGVDHHTDDARQFVEALGYERVSLIGVSMGGRTAYNLAATSPDLVERLVIVDISPGIVAAGAERITSNVQSNDRFASLDEAVAAQQQMFPNAGAAAVRRRVANNLMLLEDGSFTWRYDEALRRNRTSRRDDTDEQWALVSKITAPTLLLHGAESDVLSADLAQRMIDTIADARLVTIPGATHTITMDQPARFLAAVTPFLLAD